MLLNAFLVMSTLAGAPVGTSGPCPSLGRLLDAAIAPGERPVPVRLGVADLPAGPGPVGTAIFGGAMPGEPRSLELAVVLVDTSQAADAARTAWLLWLEDCVRSRTDSWVRTERDPEIEDTASKAVGRFPGQAYIREDAVPAGIRFVHEASGARLDAVTDPGEIAARSAVADYHGPDVILLIRITPAQ